MRTRGPAGPSSTVTVTSSSRSSSSSPPNSTGSAHGCSGTRTEPRPRDIDSARRFATDLTEAINRVGARHDLSPRWLNDDAAAFWPTGKSFSDCSIVYQRDNLVARTPSPEVIFVMKLYRADPQDREDMITLWSLETSPCALG